MHTTSNLHRLKALEGDLYPFSFFFFHLARRHNVGNRRCVLADNAHVHTLDTRTPRRQTLAPRRPMLKVIYINIIPAAARRERRCVELIARCERRSNDAGRAISIGGFAAGRRTYRSVQSVRDNRT